MKTNTLKCFVALLCSGLIFFSCKKDGGIFYQKGIITIENVLDSKPLVESGTFRGEGTPPVIFPGQSVSFSFSAAKNQHVTFASMYGWSNDLFFAPANPGIALYKDDGTAV
ncbi:MAG: spondin domain-containing protein, partial [Terrimonas sp.]|nr:spondin domain-containing protein [Terrimonas sp.]